MRLPQDAITRCFTDGKNHRWESPSRRDTRPARFRDSTTLHGRVTPHRHGSVHRVTLLQKMTANELPSKMKDKPCISYSRPFLPMSTMLVAARSASLFLSSLSFWCFVANC